MQVLDIIRKKLVEPVTREFTSRSATSLAEVTADDGHALEFLLGDLLLHHLDIDRVDGQKTVNRNRTVLTDAMATVHGLRILVRVPIGVENDARVGRGEVDAQTTSTGTQQEDEVSVVGIVSRPSLSGRLLGVEDVHLPLAIIDLGTTVNTAVLPLAEEKVILNNIQEGRHLTEDEDLVLVMEQTLQHSIEEGKLATGTDEELRVSRTEVDAGGRIDRLTKEEGMVSILPLIHLLVGLTEAASLLDTLVE